jgi:glycosyltransferase involved in cell wall biosynthesis
VDAFLHPPRSREEVRKELGLEDDHVAFATVARLFERKGHDDILDVAREVLDINPKVRFVWIGGGTWRDRLESRARDLGVRDAIHFTGLVPSSRIPELLGAVDAVLHPSHREGLARVLPQGLIAGKPAISYDVDGAREVVIHGQTGHLLPFRDRDALRKSILALACDQALRDRMGAAGRALCVERFRHEHMTAEIRKVYERILAGAPAGVTG